MHSYHAVVGSTYEWYCHDPRLNKEVRLIPAEVEEDAAKLESPDEGGNDGIQHREHLEDHGEG